MITSTPLREGVSIIEPDDAIPSKEPGVLTDRADAEYPTLWRLLEDVNEENRAEVLSKLFAKLRELGQGQTSALTHFEPVELFDAVVELDTDLAKEFNPQDRNEIYTRIISKLETIVNKMDAVDRHWS